MKPFFNFKSLIEKYNSTFTLRTYLPPTIDSKGDYVKSTPVDTQKNGAIISISDYKIYSSDGYYTVRDKNLFMSEQLNVDYDAVKIIYQNSMYKIESSPNDNNEYTGVWTYILKYVSVFND